MISPDANIDPDAIIGNGCRIEAGATIGPGVQLREGVTIGQGAILMNCVIGATSEIAPGSILQGRGADTQGLLTLEPGVVVMTGVVISEPVHIATGARIQAGAVVTRDVPPHAIVSGNPAQIVGYTLSSNEITLTSIDRLGASAPAASETRVRGVTLHRFPRILDLRGNLTFGEFGRTVPFEPKRYFMVFGVPNAEIRGEHAHRECKQFLICAQGHCSVLADNGREREEFLLDDPSIGLYLPPLTWGVQYKYSADAVLLVFTSHYYDAAEYIRSYDEFRTFTSDTIHEAIA